MAYINNGKIDIPLGYDQDDVVEEIAGLLNVNPRADGLYRIADVCLAENINKWSRCKPIEHPSTSPLTSEQRKGSADQQADGIFYGIKINGNINHNIDASLAQVHDVTFEYVRPTRWKRLLDFDGYVHGAMASPSYTMGDEGTWEDDSTTYGGIRGINIYYSTTDKSGVNLTDRLVGVNVNDTLKHAFPAIVITKDDGTYMTALFLQGTTIAEPLMDSDGRVDSTRYYQAIMNKPVYSPVSTDISPNSPFNKAEIVTASVVLIRSASTTQPLLNAANTAANNFGLNWIKLQNGLKTQAFPVVLAGDNGMTITLKDLFKGVKFIPDTIGALAVNGRNPSIYIRYVETTGETSTNEITLTARVTITSIKTAQGGIRIPSGAGGTKVETLNGWNGGALINQVIVPCAAICQSGETWSGYVTLSTKDGNREAQNSGRYDFIFTVA